MRKILFCSILLLATWTLAGQGKKPVKIVLLGTFHFDNPGLDVAKFKNADILSPKRQQEVMEVVQALREFAPDKIFIEATPDRQYRVDSSIKEYKAGNLQLRAGEVHQLAYRLAKELNLPTVYAVDYRDAEFPFDSLMKSAAEAGQADFISFVKKSIDSIEVHFNTTLDRSTIREMLLMENTDHSRGQQVGFYFKLLGTGKPGKHVGPYLVSEWWRRNMVIYDNILKKLDGREKRILVLFGAGHTALLHEMMKYNPDFELVPVHEVLKAGRQ